MSVRVWGYHLQELGKTFGKSKRQFTWKFALDGQGHTIELIVSFLTGKKRILHNGMVAYEGQKFQAEFKIGDNRIVIFQTDEGYDLMINTDLFSNLWDVEINRKHRGINVEELYRNAGHNQNLPETVQTMQTDSEYEILQRVPEIYEEDKKRARFGGRALDTVMANAAFEKLDCSAIKIEFKDDQHFKRRNPDEFNKYRNTYSKSYVGGLPRVIREEDEEEDIMKKPMKIKKIQKEMNQRQENINSDVLVDMFTGYGTFTSADSRSQRMNTENLRGYFDFGSKGSPVLTPSSKQVSAREKPSGAQWTDKESEITSQPNFVDLLGLDSARFKSKTMAKTSENVALLDQSQTNQNKTLQNRHKAQPPVDIASALGEIFSKATDNESQSPGSNSGQIKQDPAIRSKEREADEKPANGSIEEQKDNRNKKYTNDIWNNDLVDLTSLALEKPTDNTLTANSFLKEPEKKGNFPFGRSPTLQSPSSSHNFPGGYNSYAKRFNQTLAQNAVMTTTKSFI